jgi:phage tail sheath protein FI
MHGYVAVEEADSTGSSSVGISASLTRELLESWCHTGLEWVQYEPANTPRLWKQVRNDVSAHLSLLWASGFLQGATRRESFFVTCDQTTMTQTDIDNGRLICHVGVAPVQPAEFVIFRISLRLKSYRQVNARHADGSLIA